MNRQLRDVAVVETRRATSLDELLDIGRIPAQQARDRRLRLAAFLDELIESAARIELGHSYDFLERVS